MEENTSNTEVIEFSNKSCRVCLQSKKLMVFLFSEHNLENSVAELYAFCTGLEVSDDDEFPQFICKTCLPKLEEAAKLKRQCLETHEFLVNLQNENEVQKSEEADFSCIEYIEMDEEEESAQFEIDSVEKQEVLEFSSDFYCAICEKQFEDEANFLKHLESQHPELLEVQSEAENESKPFTTCHRCQLSFESKWDLEDHLQDYHFDEAGFYLCEEEDCKVQIATAAQAYHHLNTHRYPALRICEICGMMFKDSVKYHRHKSDHKNNVPLICDFCGILVKRKSNMARHIRTCHLNQKYYCEYCSKSYTDLMSLKAHKIKEHDVNAPFYCENCGQPFLFLSQFKIHMSRSICKRRRRKQDEKPTELRCPICDRCFSNETNLKRHNDTIHLKIKKFECERCNKSFGQKTALEAHFRTHTGEKPFVCVICKARYSDRSTLYRHLKNIHKDTEATTKSRMIKQE